MPPVMGIISTNIRVKDSFLVLGLAMIYLVSAGIYSLKK
jgi:hypothetical protein